MQIVGNSRTRGKSKFVVKSADKIKERNDFIIKKLVRLNTLIKTQTNLYGRQLKYKEVRNNAKLKSNSFGRLSILCIAVTLQCLRKPAHSVI